MPLPARRLTGVLLAIPVALALTAQAAPTAPTKAETPLWARTGPAVPRPEEMGADRLEPGDAQLAKVVYPHATVPAGAWERASQQAKAITARTRQVAPAAAAASWELVGPTNIGGRVLEVVVDTTRKDTAFALAASGGVWETNDAGKTYHAVWPAENTQAMGAMAISKTGVLYVGTGEAGPGGGSITYAGNGVYRSRDRGKTWQRIGLTGSARIGRIAIDPADERRIFVAATGNLFVPGGERGLYLSTNSGDTWTQVLAGDNDTTGAADIAIDPSNPQTVFVTMWDHLREPDRRRYNGIGSGVYKSTDGGTTWARIGTPFLGPHPGIGRIGIAVAPSDPQQVFAAVSTESGVFLGFFVSTDGGTTFTPRTGVPLVQGAYVYGWWFGRVYVDPKDPAHIFVPGVNLSVTTDGGMNWGGGPNVHADQHGMSWDPAVEGRVYLGNDGGMYTSHDNGENFEHGEYMPWNQPYSIDVAEDDTRRIVMGFQDNGSNRSYRQDEDGEVESHGPGEYNEYLGGDGEAARISPDDHKVVYACYQYGACSVSYDGGDTMNSFENSIVASRKNWFTPIEFDPDDASIVYTGGESLWRSTDDGANWAPISTTLDFSNGPGRETNPLFRNFGTITTISPTNSDDGVIWVGTDDGNVWVSTNWGSSFTKIVNPALPKAWVTRVQVDPANVETAYVTFSGYRSGEGGAHVFRTTDTGATWTDISTKLPQAPVNDINVIPLEGGKSVLAVATDVGVFLSKDLGTTWLRLGADLPNAPVTELRWHAPSGDLYAASFGRGGYRVDLAAALAGGGATVVKPKPPAAPTRPRVVPPKAPLAATGLPVGVTVLATMAALTAVVLRRRAYSA